MEFNGNAPSSIVELKDQRDGRRSGKIKRADMG